MQMVACGMEATFDKKKPLGNLAKWLSAVLANRNPLAKINQAKFSSGFIN